jgi:hypothetical protein
MTLDLVNSFFQLGMAIIAWMNVVRLLRDRKVRGVTPLTVAWPMLMGWWNIIYFSTLGHYFSLVVGIALAAANTLWVTFWVKGRLVSKRP